MREILTDFICSFHLKKWHNLLTYWSCILITRKKYFHTFCNDCLYGPEGLCRILWWIFGRTSERDIHYYIFCKLMINPSFIITNYKIVSDILIEIASRLDIVSSKKCCLYYRKHILMTYMSVRPLPHTYPSLSNYTLCQFHMPLYFLGTFTEHP